MTSYPYYLANVAETPNADLAVTDKYTGEVAAIWRDMEIKYKERPVRIHAERSPEGQKRYATAGRFKAFLETKLGQQGTVDCTWAPRFVIKVTNGRQDIEVASGPENGELETDDARVRSVFGADSSKEGLMREFAAFKQ